MSFEITRYNSFKKDLKRCKKRGYDFTPLKIVVNKLHTDGKLPKKYKAHKLSGKYKGRWECHIKPDWLLIWQQDDKAKKIALEHTGTHADLFK